MRHAFRYSFATALTAGLVVAPAAAALGDTTTDGSGGVGSGNQVVVPVDVEAGLCGDALAVLGISEATCTQVSKVLYEASGEGGASTDGSGGVASGNQIIVPVDAAVSVCGNSVAILGVSNATCTTIINVIQASPENEGGASTDGSGGVASGNQVVVPVDAAVDICGNAVSVLGLAEASCMEIISEEEPEEEPERPQEPGEEPEPPEEPEQETGETPEEEPERPEDEGEEDDSSTADASPPRADERLPVTGGALTGLVAAGVAAVGAGGAGLYLARKRRASAAENAGE